MVLAEKSRKQKYTATLLPIRTVGVQVSWQTGFFGEFSVAAFTECKDQFAG